MAEQTIRVSTREDILRGDSGLHGRRDSLENRRRILEAARRLFDDLGVEPVTMHRIAQAAGVGQATMYRHYVNKGELCHDLIAESAAVASDELGVYLRESDGQPALDRLDGILLRIVTFIEAKLPYLATIGEACAGENRTTKFNLPEYRWLYSTISDLLSDAQREGTVRSADLSFTAAAVLAALSPDMYQFQHEERGLSNEQIVQRVRSLYT